MKTREQVLHERVSELVEAADRAGYVVTVERVSRFPPAQGNTYPRVSVRKKMSLVRSVSEAIVKAEPAK